MILISKTSTLKGWRKLIQADFQTVTIHASWNAVLWFLLLFCFCFFPKNCVNISCTPRCSIICVRSRVSSMEKLERWNICWHVTITMTHYLLTAATSNGQKCQVTFTESSQFLHLWATASCACEAGPWTRYGVYQAKNFLYHGHLPFSFFHAPRQHLGGGICYVVALWCAAKNVGITWMSFRPHQLRLSDAGSSLKQTLWSSIQSACSCNCPISFEHEFVHCMYFDYCQMCEWATLCREH